MELFCYLVLVPLIVLAVLARGLVNTVGKDRALELGKTAWSAIRRKGNS